MNKPEASAESAAEQGLLSHLVELRSRLLRSVVAILLVFGALFPIANRLYALIATPLLERLPSGGSMIAIDVITPFFTPIKLAFFTAIFIAMPYLLYQVWAFVAPGLYRQEQRLALPLFLSATVLFYVGAAFAYFVVLPLVFGFLTGTVPEGVSMMTDINKYLDFVLMTFLAFGLCFEIPVAVVILATLGVVTPESLVKHRGYVIVGAFVVAAVVTPPDALSQILLAVPMCLLYELGVFAARAVVARRPKDVAE
jgi:sec-independent protein translocase protein TatC